MGAEVILCTSVPYDEYQSCDTKVWRGGYSILLGYAEYLKSYGREKGYEVCDYHSYITRAMQDEVLFETDRVHPNSRGQYFMAKCFLENQGLDLGDEQPLPDDIKEWCHYVELVRNTIATEHFILKDDFSTTEEERMTAIKKYLEVDHSKDICGELFTSLSKQYVEIKKDQKKNVEYVMNFFLK